MLTGTGVIAALIVFDYAVKLKEGRVGLRGLQLRNTGGLNPTIAMAHCWMTRSSNKYLRNPTA
jgi:hypothetical protein